MAICIKNEWGNNVTTSTEAVSLRNWTEVNLPERTMYSPDNFLDQINFIRDILSSVLAKTEDEFMLIKKNIKVIANHTIRSTKMPVYQIQLTDGTTFILRYDFHDWKISVNSPHDVTADFMGLFNPNKPIVDCKAFPEEFRYGPYAENKRQFTLELMSNEYCIYTFFWIYAHQVLGNRNKRGFGR